LAIGACVFALLAVVASRYGYHRDELYFVEAGHHLAWGYPDQPPLVPVLARLMNGLGRGSVAVLRLPSALAGALVVPLTAAIARQCGAEPAAQLLAAGVMATGGFLIGTGHLLSTATFDFFAWVLICGLVLAILRGGDERLWLAVGAVAGAGLLVSDLVAFLIAAIVGGIAIAGPRRTFASPWLWVGGLTATAMWMPYLVWQARHGWPQLTVSRAIAAGHSGSSAPRWALLPEQLVLISPWLAPVWIAGLVRLLREPALRFARAFGWAWILLAVAFVISGGKPYYPAGLFPVLVAAGAEPTLGWLRRGRVALRRVALAIAFVLSALGSVLIGLPVVPIADLHKTSIVKLNYDIGETVAWPTYVHEIAFAWDQLPVPVRAHAAILTSNYGEAGAIDRYGPALGLPKAYSGHMGFWYWGPPTPTATSVLGVGFDPGYLERYFTHVRLLARLENHLGVNNDEQHAPVWLATRLRGSWAALWPRFKNLG